MQNSKANNEFRNKVLEKIKSLYDNPQQAPPAQAQPAQSRTKSYLDLIDDHKNGKLKNGELFSEIHTLLKQSKTGNIDFPNEAELIHDRIKDINVRKENDKLKEEVLSMLEEIAGEEFELTPKEKADAITIYKKFSVDDPILTKFKSNVDIPQNLKELVFVRVDSAGNVQTALKKRVLEPILKEAINHGGDYDQRAEQDVERVEIDLIKLTRADGALDPPAVRKQQYRDLVTQLFKLTNIIIIKKASNQNEKTFYSHILGDELYKAISKDGVMGSGRTIKKTQKQNPFKNLSGKDKELLKWLMKN